MLVTYNDAISSTLADDSRRESWPVNGMRYADCCTHLPAVRFYPPSKEIRMQAVRLLSPYLIFLGDETRKSYAKTGSGLVDWRRELCVGQLRLTRATADLGLPDMTIPEALAAGARSVVVGTALIGGSMPDKWLATLAEAAASGMDIVAGFHSRLVDVEALVTAAAESGSRLVDVRTPPMHLPVGSGTKRSGKRLLTVGTDCAVGKKYTALQLEKEMRLAGQDADFRASGQTGIMIAGEGIVLDAVVSDFLSGAAELLSPDNEPEHWDVIEGQGSIFHPAYAAVSHGLLIGSQPDGFVVCHQAHRVQISGWNRFPIPTVGDVIERTMQIGSLTNPGICCVGISVNTSALPAGERKSYLTNLADKYGLPCVDPLLEGTGAIVDSLTDPHR